MTNQVYGAIGLIGTGAGDLEAIDGNAVLAPPASVHPALLDKDIAMSAVKNGRIYHHILNATADDLVNSPFTIPPLVNPGTKNWELAAVLGATLNGVESVGSTANVILLTVSPGILAYVDGDIFQATVANANTSTVTVNVNGIGAIAVVKQAGAALVAGDIQPGPIRLMYDAGNTRAVLISPVGNAAGGGGGLVPISRTTVIAGSNSLVIGGFTSTFDNYRLVGRGFTFTGVINFNFSLGTGPSTFDTGSNYDLVDIRSNGSVFSFKNTSTTSYVLNNFGFNLVSQFIVELKGMPLVGDTNIEARTGVSQQYYEMSMGTHRTAQANTHIRFNAGAQTISSGVVDLYGYENP